MAIVPKRAINITQVSNTAVDFITDQMDPSGLWVSYPYKWEVVLTVEPLLNSGATPEFSFNANHISVGDWLATTNFGIATQITEIISVPSETEITLIVEDKDLYNILNDPSFSGMGIGPDGPGIAFPIDEVSKLPVLGPITAYKFDINLQMDLFARFIQQGELEAGGDPVVEVPTVGDINDGAVKGWVGGETLLSDAVNQLNFLLGKALPARPADFADLKVLMTRREKSPYGVLLAQGTIPNNSTATPNYADSVTAIEGLTAVSETLTGVGLGNMGTLSFALNGTVAGTFELTNDTLPGTNGSLTIVSEYDFPPGSDTWSALDISFTTPILDGINEIALSHTMTGTAKRLLVVETLTDEPIITATQLSVTTEQITYVSGIPHYTKGTQLSYNMTADKIVGRTFVAQDMMGLKSTPSVFTASISHDTTGMPEILSVNHAAITMAGNAIELTADGVAAESTLAFYANSPFKTTETPLTQTLLYKSGEGNFLVETPTELNVFQTNIKRVALGDGPRPVDRPILWDTNWDSGSNGSLGDLAAWEAPIIGGVAREVRVNLNTYLPAGPDLSGKPATQYISFKVKAITNRLKLNIAGTYSAIYIKLPGITNSMPNATNGWWDGSKQADHAPLNWPGHTNAGDGCLLSKNGETVEFTFGNISSASSTENMIFVRFALGENDEIQSIRIAE